MVSVENCIKDLFDEEKPFYTDASLVSIAKEEMQASKPKELVSYSVSFGSYKNLSASNLIERVSNIFYQVYLEFYNWVHFLTGLCMSTTGRIAIKLSGGAAKSPDAYRAMICHSSTESEIDPWIFKRIVVKVSYLDIAGYERKEDIDAVIIGKPSTWFQGRFVVPTYGLGRFYERAVGDFTLDEDPKLLPVLLTQLKANAVVFNYPGIGESTGVLTREGMISAYRGVLCMLEDKDSGIGASEIISMGHSIGGAVQAEAIEQHDLKKDINYVFVKFLTFSTLRKTLSDLICCIAGFVINQVGWNMSSINRQKGFQNPEIVIQTANVDSFEEVFDPNLITHDKVISADASLAKYHLENTPSSKIIMGFPGDHSDRFGTWASQLGSVINQVASKVLR